MDELTVVSVGTLKNLPAGVPTTRSCTTGSKASSTPTSHGQFTLRRLGILSPAPPTTNHSLRTMFGADAVISRMPGVLLSNARCSFSIQTTASRSEASAWAKDSSKYVYWQEIEQAYGAGHSFVIYQHFARVARDLYTSRLAEQLAGRLNAPLVDSFRTSHVGVFLVARPEHSAAFERAHEEITTGGAARSEHQHTLRRDLRRPIEGRLERG